MAAAPLALLMLLPACTGPSATAVAEPRAAAGFTEIALLGSADLVVREGDRYEVKVLAEPERHERVITRVEGNTLIVDTETEIQIICIDCRSPVVEVTLPEMRALRIDGSGDAQVLTAKPNAGVALGIHGSGSIHYRGRTAVLRVAIDGSGDVDLAGAAGRLEASISGSGALEAEQLLAASGSFEVSGSGDMTVHLGGGDADFVIEGSGDIRWSGQARVRRSIIEGSGDISHF
jgi:hypothetical protein